MLPNLALQNSDFGTGTVLLPNVVDPGLVRSGTFRPDCIRIECYYQNMTLLQEGSFGEKKSVGMVSYRTNGNSYFCF